MSMSTSRAPTSRLSKEKGSSAAPALGAAYPFVLIMVCLPSKSSARAGWRFLPYGSTDVVVGASHSTRPGRRVLPGSVARASRHVGGGAFAERGHDLEGAQARRV